MAVFQAYHEEYFVRSGLFEGLCDFLCGLLHESFIHETRGIYVNLPIVLIVLLCFEQNDMRR